MADARQDSPKLQVVSQAFRYCEYGAGHGQSRTLRIGATPIQFVVNLWRDPSLEGKEVEVQIEVRDERTLEPIFETLWVTRLTHPRQESALVFKEFPLELKNLEPGIYSYYASAYVNETGDTAERSTRAIVK